jgi:hypothetical protein
VAKGASEEAERPHQVADLGFLGFQEGAEIIAGFQMLTQPLRDRTASQASVSYIASSAATYSARSSSECPGPRRSRAS